MRGRHVRIGPRSVARTASDRRQSFCQSNRDGLFFLEGVLPIRRDQGGGGARDTQRGLMSAQTGWSPTVRAVVSRDIADSDCTRSPPVTRSTRPDGVCQRFRPGYGAAMSATNLPLLFATAISRRPLLEHPFYQRWQAGELSMVELGEYAEQYRHFERCLPQVLSAVAERLPAGEARDSVAANLADEQHVPRPHIDLFETFASAVGAQPDAPATPATRELVELYRSAADDDPVRALFVIGTYELQAADVASTKANSLRAHYGLSRDDTSFWDVHAQMECDHAGWTVHALDALGEFTTWDGAFADVSADAWWAFLDERDGVTPMITG